MGWPYLAVAKQMVSEGYVEIAKGKALRIVLRAEMDFDISNAELVAMKTGDVEPNVRVAAVKGTGDGTWHNARSWMVTGYNYAPLDLEAKLGEERLDFVHLRVLPSTYFINLTPKMRAFHIAMAEAGRQAASDYHLPLSAMLAVACGESAHGTGDKYRASGCPFNLQKPDDWAYPQCKTVMLRTKSKVDQPAAPAPFCKADNLSHAAELWCQWIEHFPNENNRKELMKLRGNPKIFAEQMHLVGFADSKPSLTKLFGKVWEQFELGRFDPVEVKKERQYP